jgi:hypothetical protein
MEVKEAARHILEAMKKDPDGRVTVTLSGDTWAAALAGLARVDELEKFQAGFEVLVDTLKAARERYTEDGVRQDERARAALRVLGFTDGKRPVKVDREALYYELVSLMTGAPDLDDISTWKDPPEPMKRADALKIMAKKYPEMDSETLNQYVKPSVVKMDRAKRKRR